MPLKVSAVSAWKFEKFLLGSLSNFFSKSETVLSLSMSKFLFEHLPSARDFSKYLWTFFLWTLEILSILRLRNFNKSPREVWAVLAWKFLYGHLCNLLLEVWTTSIWKSEKTLLRNMSKFSLEVRVTSFFKCE